MIAPSPTPAEPAEAPSPRRPPSIVDRGTVRRAEVEAERWHLRGTAKVLGPVKVGLGVVDGTLVAEGPLVAETFTSRGSLELTGPVEVRGRLATEGTFRARSLVRAGEADLRGTTRLFAGIEVARALSVRGSFSSARVEAGAFDLRGTAEVPGALRCGRLYAQLTGNSSFSTIEAREVRLRGRPTRLVDRALLHHTEVKVERIEAEAVALEAVDVEFVRAPTIALGSGAHVTRLEGTVVQVHATSRVGPESKSPPPYGLRR